MDPENTDASPPADDPETGADLPAAASGGEDGPIPAASPGDEPVEAEAAAEEDEDVPVSPWGRGRVCALLAFLLCALPAIVAAVDVSLSKGSTKVVTETRSVDDEGPGGAVPAQVYPRLTGSSFGDVHISTFDGLRFDCMASGHFLLLTSLEEPSFRIEGLFATKTLPGRASWTTGVAVSGIDGEAPTVQIGTPKPSDGGGDPEGMFAFGCCPIDMYVDGEQASLGDYLGGSIEVYPSKSRGGADRIVIMHRATNFAVDVDVRNSGGSFGCFLDVHVSIPGSYRADETLLGLLGTRNGVPGDDWVGRDGTPLPIPEDRYDRLEEPAYKYCVENWGIREEGETIFNYKSGESFDGMNKLDAEYDGDDLRDVPEELALFCGDDLA